MYDTEYVREMAKELRETSKTFTKRRMFLGSELVSARSELAKRAEKGIALVSRDHSHLPLFMDVVGALCQAQSALEVPDPDEFRVRAAEVIFDAKAVPLPGFDA